MTFPGTTLAKARWRILSEAVQGVHHSSEPDSRQPGSHSDASQTDGIEPARASRRPRVGQGFALFRTEVSSSASTDGDITVEYSLPLPPINPATIRLRQKAEGGCLREELVIAQQSGNDSTGIVGVWPAEEVLAYFCVQHAEDFRGKRVVELGAGCGLAGMAVAACTAAQSVLLSDGNPRVISALAESLEANRSAFGDTAVSARVLRWEESQDAGDAEQCMRDGMGGEPGINASQETCDIIIAADCTFFSEAHSSLASTIDRLLGPGEANQALLFNPRRGNSLDSFVAAALRQGLDAQLVEDYEQRVSELDAKFSSDGGSSTWPSYDREHCYPILLRLKRLKDRPLA